MKDTFIKSFLNEIKDSFTDEELVIIENKLKQSLNGLQITEDEKTNHSITNVEAIQKFISSKKIEGCSDKTIKFYLTTLKSVLVSIDKPIKLISTDDLRNYISDYQSSSGVSNVTIDNIRRILSSFFKWLEDESYIFKSPVRRIHKVKCEQIVKEAITDEQLVSLKDACTTARDLALIEVLSSTGIRVGELVKLNICDINFNERSCIVLGKGKKQREVYFDAKTKIHLSEYLKNRKDDNSALFVSLNDPHNRLTISGIEYIVKKIGEKCNIKKVHPHKFRRTLATFAIDKGMPIEQVQKLLGHVKIDTTLHYAIVNQNNIKISHRKYIS